MSERMDKDTFRNHCKGFAEFGNPHLRKFIAEARRARAREETLERENAEAKAEIARLREALAETADALEDALAYKQDYLREKHGDDETLAKARAFLAPKP